MKGVSLVVGNFHPYLEIKGLPHGNERVFFFIIICKVKGET